MRILSFSYCFPNQANPTFGVFVEHRLAAMARRADLRVVSPSPWFPASGWIRGTRTTHEESWHGVRVYRPRFLCIPKIMKSHDGALYARSLQRWLLTLLADWKPDLLDAHFVWPDGVGVASLARSVRIPYSVTLRGKIHPCLEIPSQRRQVTEALIRAEQVISVDPRMAQLAADLGVPAQRIQVISNGVDLKHFQNIALHNTGRAETRRALGLPTQGRMIVTVAHLGQRKGHHETIRALPSLPNDVQLVLVGGPGPSGGDAERLQNLAEKLGVAGRLTIAGKQSHDRIPKYYQAADVTVLASWREGCPNTVLESLACGTPVVATDVGSVSCMIDDGVNGRIVPVRNVERLRDGIQSMLDYPPAAQQVRQSQALRSWDAVADEVLRLFEQTIAGRTTTSCASGIDISMRPHHAH